jgi:Ca2+-binding RTX toxin-like protein
VARRGAPQRTRAFSNQAKEDDMIVNGSNSSETLDKADGVTEGADVILGNGGNDTIFGFGGNDVIQGGTGADTIDGGDDIDTANYLDSTSGVIVSLLTGKGKGGSAEGDVLSGIENLTGSNHDDTLYGDNGKNVLYGRDGHDTLKGFGGLDTLWGGNGNDKLYGMDSADDLYGGAGDDILDGGIEADEMFGGTGNDSYYIDHLADKVTENAGEGIDTIYRSLWNPLGPLQDNVENLVLLSGAKRGEGNGLDNTIAGNDGENVLLGHDGDDTLIGGDGGDHLFGGEGIDTMIGGADDDYYTAEQGDIIIEEDGGGTDWVFVTESFELPDHVENLTMSNIDDDDPLNIDGTGNDLPNNIWATTGNNVLNGKGGADELLGREGVDTLTGGSGGDTFLWSYIKETGVTQATADVITDFNFAAGDRIDLSSIDANVYADGEQSFTFVGTTFTLNPATPDNTDVIPGEINYYHSGGNTYIQLQTGTSPDPEGVIRLNGIHTPQASWFVL